MGIENLELYQFTFKYIDLNLTYSSTYQ